MAGTSEVLSVEDGKVRLRPSHTSQAPAPWFDIILAMPRPKALKRLLPQLAALGAERIFLVNAWKVEKCYFSSQWVEPAACNALLLEGLMQCGATKMPKIELRPRFRPFIEDELEALFPKEGRYIAHPEKSPTPLGKIPKKIVLAVGPEGGWTEFERNTFLERGFKPFSLGARVLRTDTACVAAISVLSHAANT